MMADVTVSITPEEIIVLRSYYETEQEGLTEAARGAILRGAYNIIRASTSQLDPAKLSVLELRAEINRLEIAGEIPTHAERTE